MMRNLFKRFLAGKCRIRTAQRPRDRREGGFTLTELLVAMVLAGIVMASLYSAYLTQQRAYETTEAVTAIQQNLRSAMLFMERDLRMAGYDPKDAGCGFSTLAEDEFQFSMDLDRNESCDDTITYKFDAGQNTLKRKINASGDFVDIASDITNVSFSYFSSAGSGTTVAGSIRYVVVDVQSGRGGHSRNLNTRVVCRNLGL